MVQSKALLELVASAAPIRQVDLLHHDLEDNNFIVVGLCSLPPEAFGGSLQIGRHTLETAGQFLLHAVEIFPGEGAVIIVRPGEKNLDEVHGDAR